MARKLSKRDNRYLARLVTVDRAPCAFCLRDVDDELIYGKLYAIGDIQCHYYCCLLSCCLIQKGNDDEGLFGFMYTDIVAELERCKKHKCSYCGRSGANLGCTVSACRKQFHLPCGREKHAVSLYYGSYKSFCQRHAPRQKIPQHIVARLRINKEKKGKPLSVLNAQDSGPADALVCVICYEAVCSVTETHSDTLWPPCCARDACFHRTCLQRMALSAGKHYLKCPLCNDKHKFYNALLDQGYYVPDRDAAWELEQNAFAEIYERPNTCCLEQCLCPQGREHDEQTGKWDIKLCLLCGSAGAHEHCIEQSETTNHRPSLDQSQLAIQNETAADESEAKNQSLISMGQSEITNQRVTSLGQSEVTNQLVTSLDQSEVTNQLVTSLDQSKVTNQHVTSLNQSEVTNQHVTSMDQSQSSSSVQSNTDLYLKESTIETNLTDQSQTKTNFNEILNKSNDIMLTNEPCVENLSISEFNKLSVANLTNEVSNDKNSVQKVSNGVTSSDTHTVCVSESEESVLLEKSVRFVCKSCLPAAPEDLTQLVNCIEAIIQQEQAQPPAAASQPIMPSRMSIRRTKGRIPIFERASTSRLTNVNVTSNTQSTESSRLELNLKTPRRREEVTEDNSASRTEDLSPLKMLEQKFREQMLNTGVKDAVLDEKLVEQLREKFRKPTPMCEKRRIVDDTLEEVFDAMKNSKQKDQIKECSPQKIYTDVENNHMSEPETSKRPEIVDKENIASTNTPTKSPRNYKTTEHRVKETDVPNLYFNKNLDNHDTTQNFNEISKIEQTNIVINGLLKKFNNNYDPNITINITSKSPVKENDIFDQNKDESKFNDDEYAKKNNNRQLNKTLERRTRSSLSNSKTMENDGDDDCENNDTNIKESNVIKKPSRDRLKKLSLKRNKLKKSRRKAFKSVVSKNMDSKDSKQRNPETNIKEVNILRRLLTEQDLCTQLLLELTTGKIDDENTNNKNPVENKNNVFSNTSNETRKDSTEFKNVTKNKSTNTVLQSLLLPKNESLNEAIKKINSGNIGNSPKKSKSIRHCLPSNSFEDFNEPSNELVKSEIDINTSQNLVKSSRRSTKARKCKKDSPETTKSKKENNLNVNTIDPKVTSKTSTQKVKSDIIKDSTLSPKRLDITQKLSNTTSKVSDPSKGFDTLKNVLEICPKVLSPINDNTLKDTPKRKTIEIQQGSSIEISKNEQIVNIDVIKVEDSPTTEDSYKKLHQNIAETNSKCKLNLNKGSRENNELIDLELFKKEYLSEVDREFVCNFKHKYAEKSAGDRKFKSTIDFAIEAASNKEDPYPDKMTKKRKLSEGDVLNFNNDAIKRRKTSESDLKIFYRDDIDINSVDRTKGDDKIKSGRYKRRKRRKDKRKQNKDKRRSNNKNIEVTIDSSETRNKNKKRIKTKVAIRNENIHLKIKWKKERFSLNIESKKSKKQKLKTIERNNSKFKQYVLQFPEGSSKEVLVKPEKEVCPLKRKYVKHEKSPDKMKQTSIHSFFKIKSEK